MSNKRKMNVQLAIASAFAVAGIFIIIVAFFVTPTGEIHNSVQFIIAQLLTFVGAIMGVDYHYKAKQDDK